MLNKRIIYSLLIPIIFLNQSCKTDNQAMDQIKPMKTVEYVDLDRFMGDWYVIASMPTIIEKGAVNAIESYKLNDKGEVETTFTFRKKTPNGKKKVYKPKGVIYNKETNAEWRMQFLWPFKMPFLIIDLAEDYSHTVIGYPNRNYVWIMARKPQMADETYARIIKKLKSVSYDVSRIEKVPQIW
jgi:apolipoprotein D and lipocalin family protein